MTGSGNGVARVPATGGGPDAVEVITESLEGETIHGFLRVLPGGKMGVFQVWHGTGGDDAEIWAIDLDSGERRFLTAGRGPAYAASGHLLFVLADGTLMAAPIDAGTAELTGPAAPVADGLAVIAPYGLSVHATSASGVLVYRGGAAADSRGGLVLVDRDGREEPLDFGAQAYQYPRFSPDGRRLAVAEPGEDTDLWVFDLERGSRSRITFGGDNRYYPVWTPDREALTYSDGNFDGNTIYTAPANGSGVAVALLKRDWREFPTSWSPDGRVLAFHENAPETGRDLWTLPVGGEAEPFLVTPFEELYPAFSPDGRWLAYVSDESGRREIYVQPYPGPGPKYTVSTEGGREPVWSADGSELFYRSGAQFMAVDVDVAGDVFRPSTPRPLFDDLYLADPGTGGSPNYDVAPDGQRFVMVSGGSQAAEGSVVLVQNFLEELKRLAPN